MIVDGDWDRKMEESVLMARNALAERFLLAGYDLVLDETFLQPFRVQELKKMLEMWDVDFAIQDFIDVPLEICLARNRERGLNRRVPDAFIIEYYENYVKPLLGL